MWVPYFKALALVFLKFFLVNSLSDTDLLVSTVPSLSHTGDILHLHGLSRANTFTKPASHIKISKVH